MQKAKPEWMSISDAYNERINQDTRKVSQYFDEDKSNKLFHIIFCSSLIQFLDKLSNHHELGMFLTFFSEESRLNKDKTSNIRRFIGLRLVGTLRC